MIRPGFGGQAFALGGELLVFAFRCGFHAEQTRGWNPSFRPHSGLAAWNLWAAPKRGFGPAPPAIPRGERGPGWRVLLKHGPCVLIGTRIWGGRNAVRV